MTEFHVGLELSPTGYRTMSEEEQKTYLRTVLFDLVDKFVDLATPELLETFFFKTTRTSLSLKEHVNEPR